MEWGPGTRTARVSGHGRADPPADSRAGAAASGRAPGARLRSASARVPRDAQPDRAAPRARADASPQAGGGSRAGAAASRVRRAVRSTAGPGAGAPFGEAGTGRHHVSTEARVDDPAEGAPAVRADRRSTPRGPGDHGRHDRAAADAPVAHGRRRYGKDG